MYVDYGNGAIFFAMGAMLCFLKKNPKDGRYLEGHACPQILNPYDGLFSCSNCLIFTSSSLCPITGSALASPFKYSTTQEKQANRHAVHSQRTTPLQKLQFRLPLHVWHAPQIHYLAKLPDFHQQHQKEVVSYHNLFLLNFRIILMIINLVHFTEYKKLFFV